MFDFQEVYTFNYVMIWSEKIEDCLLSGTWTGPNHDQMFNHGAMPEAWPKNCMLETSEDPVTGEWNTRARHVPPDLCRS